MVRPEFRLCFHVLGFRVKISGGLQPPSAQLQRRDCTRHAHVRMPSVTVAMSSRCVRGSFHCLLMKSFVSLQKGDPRRHRWAGFFGSSCSLLLGMPACCISCCQLEPQLSTYTLCGCSPVCPHCQLVVPAFLCVAALRPMCLDGPPPIKPPPPPSHGNGCRVLVFYGFGGLVFMFWSVSVAGILSMSLMLLAGICAGA